MSNELRDRLTAWTYRKQALNAACTDPLAALERICAVYSSHPSAPLSLLARTEALDADQFRRLERERHAVRLPAMRASVFLMPAETAPRLLAATSVPMEKHRGRLEYAGLTWDDYEELKPRVLEATAEPVTPAELQEAVSIDGKLMVAVRLMSYEGLILRVGTSLRSDSLTYVAAESWLGHALHQADPDESLQWLAGRYLDAFGPARLADFAWWAGVTKRRAREALSNLSTVDIGDGLLLHESEADAFERQEPLDPDAVSIIPKWDAYTMAYAADGRSRLMDDEHVPLAYPKVSATRGDGLPLVLRCGRAVATWGHRFSGNRMDVTVTPFEVGERMDWMHDAVFEPVARLLDATDYRVTVVDRD